jgi:hypothetical protein
MGTLKLNDESNRLVQQLQIGKKLGFVNGKNTLDALQVKDHDVLDNQIKAIPAVKGHSFVNYRYGDLSLKTQTP